MKNIEKLRIEEEGKARAQNQSALGENLNMYPIESELAKKIGTMTQMGNEMKGVPFHLLARVLIWYLPDFIWMLQNIGVASYIGKEAEKMIKVMI